MVQQQNAAVPRPRRRCDSVHPLHFCPCGVVQTTCLPLMQEITGAKPVRDTRFHLRFTNCDFGSRAQAPRCTAFREANVYCGHLTCRTWEVHSGWGLHSFAIDDFRLTISMTAVEPALRQVSYARCARGSTGDCDQPSLFELRLAGHFRPPCRRAADFLCKKVVPGQHRWEAPLLVDGFRVDC